MLLIVESLLLLGPIPRSAHALDADAVPKAANSQEVRPAVVATLGDVMNCPCHLSAREGQGVNVEASGDVRLPDGASQGGNSGSWFTLSVNLRITAEGNGRAVILLKFNDQDVLTFIIYHSDGNPYDLQYVTVEQSVRQFSDGGEFQVAARNYPTIYAIHGGLNAVTAVVDGSAFAGSVDATIDGESSVIEQTPVPPNRLQPSLVGDPTQLDDGSWIIPIIARNLGPDTLHNVVATITAGAKPVARVLIGDVVTSANALITVPAGSLDGLSEARLSLRGDERYAFGSAAIYINLKIADSDPAAHSTSDWQSRLLWLILILFGATVALIALRSPNRSSESMEVRVGDD